MSDTIRGPVTKVVDGDTFEMDVTHIGKENKKQYREQETV
jgi:endonuclease YncB( thermonuclease family)